MAEDRQSQIVWQTVNEVSKRKNMSRAACQEERTHMGKKHFKNLLGKPPKVTDKSIMKIDNYQLDIKLGQFTQDKLDIVLTKIKNRKAASLDEIPPERQGNSITYCSDTVTLCITRTQ